LAQWCRGLGIDDGQNFSGENSPDDQAVTFDRDDPVLLVENGLIRRFHLLLDAPFRVSDSLRKALVTRKGHAGEGNVTLE
jgi:hypothetical protein